MEAIKIKKVNGFKSVVVNNLNCDLKSAYTLAKNLDIRFYVIANGSLQMWGLFSVCDFLGISNVSEF